MRQQSIKSLELANISDQHSSTSTLKFDIGNDLQKYLLWKQYLAWYTNGWSTAPVRDFMNNPIAQELTKENEYFRRMTITIETKTPLVKKMRLKV